MSPENTSTVPDIFALVLWVGVVWVVAWLITRRRASGDSARRRWLRFGVYGIFWLVLASAFVLREWQWSKKATQDYLKITRLQQELDVAGLRSKNAEQQLRDRIELLERQLKK